MSQTSYPNAKVTYCPRCGTFITGRSCFQESDREDLHHSHFEDKDLTNEYNDGDLTKTDLEILEMAYVIQKLQTHRALTCRLRNQHVPIARLPVEVMSEIFMWGFVISNAEKKEIEPTTFPLILCRVCHNWRQIAWGLSELWSFFHCRISERLCSSQAALLEEWLNRSQQRLLSICISIEDEDAWTSSANTANEIIDVLITHCNRWCRLNLILPEHWYERLSEVHGKTPNLIELSMRPPSSIFVVRPLDAFSDAPNLRSLHSSHYYLRYLHFPWVQLTTAMFETASADEALELIRRCPNLTTCRFENLNEMEDNFPVDIVTHPQIQFLEVSLDSSAVFGIFLVYLDLPSLCSLAVTIPETHHTPIPAIEGLIERSACPLKIVHIKGSFISEQDIITFLTYNHSVTEVKVE